jgi:hypothetical protein
MEIVSLRVYLWKMYSKRAKIKKYTRLNIIEDLAQFRGVWPKVGQNSAWPS